MSEKKDMKELLEWTMVFIKKKNAIESRGIWTERDYFIDGNLFHIVNDWFSINGERGELKDITPLKLFMEDVK